MYRAGRILMPRLTQSPNVSGNARILREMNTQIRQLQPDDIKIQEIIDSFEQFAIEDIKHNLEKPIAAFILCSCLIDQIAAFAYNHGSNENKKYYKKFIKEYLPTYNPLRLYNDLRCLLVHNYSISEYLAISTEHPLIDGDTQSISINHVTVKSLLNDLEIAFKSFSMQLCTDTQTRINALKRYAVSPPLIAVNRKFWKYSEFEADFLISRYLDKVVGKLMNSNNEFRISSLIKRKIDDTKEPFIVTCVCFNQGKEYYAHLDIITQQLGLLYPIDALKKEGLC